MALKKKVSPARKSSSARTQKPARLTLADLVKDARSRANSDVSFTTDDFIGEYVASNNNVQFQVELSDGKIITFWSDTMDKVLSVSEDGTEFTLLAGVTISKDGGLIPPSSQKERKYRSLR